MELRDAEELPTPSNDRFSILAHGADSHYFLESGLIPIFGSVGMNGKDLRGRRIAIRWSLDHSRYPAKQLGELARKWQSLGQLWTGKTLSDPVIVDVPVAPDASECPREI
jgi:hypothetical protein